jgi:Polyketide cyclase / dehydrase and lipid transport
MRDRLSVRDARQLPRCRGRAKARGVSARSRPESSQAERKQADVPAGRLSGTAVRIPGQGSRDGVSERGWVPVQNEIEIARSPETVFDYLTDITREVEWNPRTKRVEKLTPGPVGVGSRFGAEWIKGNPMVIEYTALERPIGWTSRARSRLLDVKGEGRVSATDRGSRVVIRTEIRPKGILALLRPLLGRTMLQREERNLQRVKAILEGAALVNSSANGEPDRTSSSPPPASMGPRGHRARNRRTPPHSSHPCWRSRSARLERRFRSTARRPQADVFR